MKTLWVLVALGLMACGPGAPDCVSELGTKLYGSTKCAELDAYESELSVQFTSFFGVDAQTLSSRMSHLEVTVRSDADSYGSFIEEGHKKVCGLYWTTDEGEGRIDVGLEDWKRSALAHEMVHMLEAEVIGLKGEAFGCSEEEIAWTATHETGKKDAPDHCSWQRRGVWKLINTVASRAC